MFQIHGLPETLRSDNGQPFASAEFKCFLEYLGISHKKGIPYWPQSNGEVERFNKTILKIIKIANIEKKDWKTETSNFLFIYRTTTHTVTGSSPAELLLGRQLKTKLPELKMLDSRPTESQWQERIRDRDAVRKLKGKEYADRRRQTKESEIKEGDHVLVKRQHKSNKLAANYELQPYEVVRRNGNAVVVRSPDGIQRMRNTSHVKPFMQPLHIDDE